MWCNVLAFLWTVGVMTAKVPESSCEPHSEASAISSSLLQSDRAIRQRIARPSLSELRVGNASDSDIDFVYCWSGESNQLDAAHDMPSGSVNETILRRDNGAEIISEETIQKYHTEGFGFGEMELSITSLQLYAPWFNKVYLLVNGVAEKPKWAADDERVVMVDRCSLFPEITDCPTNNTAACQSVVHLVPDLKEKFVYMDDDYIFVKPVKPDMFFTDDGEPILTANTKNKSLVRVYELQDGGKKAGQDMPPDRVPYRVNDAFPHQPIPMLVSFNTRFESDYNDWFKFVRSHKNRFTCCDASINSNGLEELFHRVYPAMLFDYGVSKTFLEPWCLTCICDRINCIEDILAEEKTLGLVLQSCYHADVFAAASKVVLKYRS